MTALVFATETGRRRYVRFICDSDRLRPSLTGDIERKRDANYCSLSPFWLDVKVTTNGHDAPSHSGGRGTNRSGGRDRRDGPTHAHARSPL